MTVTAAPFSSAHISASAEGVNMPKDQRDVLEILKFDLFEETVGSWLRSIIKRLEEERTAISTGSLADRSPDGTERT